MNGKVNLGQVSLALAFPLNKSGMWYKGEKSPTDCEKEECCYFHENPKKNNAQDFLYIKNKWVNDD
jgi:uncharacterized membrane protein YfbV (UPF0208 family)